MARYGLVVDTGESPPQQRPRRRMSKTGQSTDGGVTPSDGGSPHGTPTRNRSRSELQHSQSHDSLDSMGVGGARSGRKGSGFKKSASKDGKGHSKPAKSSFADLHIIGELVGASGFTQPMLFCRWQLLYEPSKSWTVLRGLQQGATHACCREVDEADMVVWEHPLDIQMQTQSLQGWPALLLMVYQRDEAHNRDSFVSYALVPLPNTPGLHKVSSQTWFAVESNRAMGRSFYAWHTGLLPRLEDETFITDLRKREDAGPFICTVGAGQVHLRLNVMFRHLGNVLHAGGESLAAALERLTTDILRQSTFMANKSAALEEHLRQSQALTEGQKLVRAGRDDRLTSARQAVEAKRRGDASPLPSEGSRASMMGGVRSSARTLGPMTPATPGDDANSEASYETRSKPRDRYADRLARRAKEKEEREAAGAAQTSAPPSEGGASGAGDETASQGGTAGASAAATPTSAAGTGGRSGGLSRAASGAAPRAPSEDGMEEISAAGGVGGSSLSRRASGMSAGSASEDDGGDAASRAAARAARRASSRKMGF